MEKKASSLAIILHLLTAFISFFVINQATNHHLWVKASLFMAWGTFFLVDFVQLLTKGKPGVAMLGAYILFFVGSSLCLVFVVWVINTLLTAANPLFNSLNWNFQIGSLFSGLLNIAASVPSLICGLILAFIALNWGSPNCCKWYKPFVTGKA
jgi:hypothetical protein